MNENSLLELIKKEWERVGETLSPEAEATYVNLEKALQLIPVAYNTTYSLGFWENTDLSYSKYLMLIITEAAEAVNADRKESYMTMSTAEFDAAEDASFITNYKLKVKGTVDEELADILIRILSLYGRLEYTTWHVTRSLNEELFKGLSLPERMYAFVAQLVENTNKPEITREQVLTASAVTVLYFAHLMEIDLLWHVDKKLKYLMVNKDHTNKY